MKNIKVVVSLKEGVLNPEAKAILHAINALGEESIKNVKIKKQFILEFSDEEKNEVEIATKLGKDLLSNPVIEDFKIEQ